MIEITPLNTRQNSIVCKCERSPIQPIHNQSFLNDVLPVSGSLESQAGLTGSLRTDWIRGVNWISSSGSFAGFFGINFILDPVSGGVWGRQRALCELGGCQIEFCLGGVDCKFMGLKVGVFCEFGV